MMDIDGDTVFTPLQQQAIEFAERPHGKRAGRFKEYLEHARPLVPDKRVSAPCSLLHVILPVRPVQYAARSSIRTRHTNAATHPAFRPGQDSVIPSTPGK